MAEASRDQNRVPTLLGVSNVDFLTPVRIGADPVTNRLLVSAVITQGDAYTYTRLTADGQVKGSAGFIHSVFIAPTGTPVAGVLTIYDSLTETGTAIMSVSLPASVFQPIPIILDVNTTTGIFVGFDGTLTNTQVTIGWR